MIFLGHSMISFQSDLTIITVREFSYMKSIDQIKSWVSGHTYESNSVSHRCPNDVSEVAVFTAPHHSRVLSVIRMKQVVGLQINHSGAKLPIGAHADNRVLQRETRL